MLATLEPTRVAHGGAPHIKTLVFPDALFARIDVEARWTTGDNTRSRSVSLRVYASRAVASERSAAESVTDAIEAMYQALASELIVAARSEAAFDETNQSTNDQNE